MGGGFSKIVDRDSWNLYPLYPLFPCSDFVSQMWGWFGFDFDFIECFTTTFLRAHSWLNRVDGGGLGGGGGCNVFLTFYAISNISRKKIWEYKPIISHLMFSSCFFCMLEILKSAPSLTATG